MKNKINDLIKTGEGYNLEFKEKIGSNLDKEICAFANANGGKIILGVENSGNVIGFKLSNSSASKIQSIARNMDPNFNVDIETIENMAVINIEEGKNKPYSVGGKFYLRIGANSQQMQRDEIREFFQKEGLVLFDEKPNTKFDLDKDFNMTSFKEFLRLANITDNQDHKSILKNLSLMEGRKMKNAGVIFFCKNVRKFFLQGDVTCVLYEGTSKTNIIDHKMFEKNLLSNFENAYKYILSKLNTNYIIKQKRTEKLELPKEAIREALINAIVHRDYFSAGHVQVDIFIDRLEISNPGGLVSGLSEEDFGKVSLPRNPLLMDLMLRANNVERVGSGIKRIKDAMKEYGLRVEFIKTKFFRVVFKRKTLIPKGSEKSSEKSSEKIIELMEKNNEITILELSKEIVLSTRAIEKSIAKLKEKGLIKRVGSAKGGYWKVLKN